MATQSDNRRAWSSIVGDLQLPPPGADGGTAGVPDPDEPVAMLIELNARYPGGLRVVREDFYSLWSHYAERAGGRWPARETDDSPVQPHVPDGLAIVAPSLYQCVLSRATLRDMVEEDNQAARATDRPPVIFRAWPDYTLYPHIDRSAPTVKADAAWRSYDACGRGVVWAVIDSGIDAGHEHFCGLELFQEARGCACGTG